MNKQAKGTSFLQPTTFTAGTATAAGALGALENWRAAKDKKRTKELNDQVEELRGRQAGEKTNIMDRLELASAEARAKIQGIRADHPTLTSALNGLAAGAVGYGLANVAQKTMGQSGLKEVPGSVKSQAAYKVAHLAPAAHELNVSPELAKIAMDLYARATGRLSAADLSIEEREDALAKVAFDPIQDGIVGVDSPIGPRATQLKQHYATRAQEKDPSMLKHVGTGAALGAGLAATPGLIAKGFSGGAWPLKALVGGGLAGGLLGAASGHFQKKGLEGARELQHLSEGEIAQHLQNIQREHDHYSKGGDYDEKLMTDSMNSLDFLLKGANISSSLMKTVQKAAPEVDQAANMARRAAGQLSKVDMSKVGPQIRKVDPSKMGPKMQRVADMPKKPIGYKYGPNWEKIPIFEKGASATGEVRKMVQPMLPDMQQQQGAPQQASLFDKVKSYAKPAALMGLGALGMYGGGKAWQSFKGNTEKMRHMVSQAYGVKPGEAIKHMGTLGDDAVSGFRHLSKNLDHGDIYAMSPEQLRGLATPKAATDFVNMQAAKKSVDDLAKTSAVDYEATRPDKLTMMEAIRPEIGALGGAALTGATGAGLAKAFGKPGWAGGILGMAGGYLGGEAAARHTLPLEKQVALREFETMIDQNMPNTLGKEAGLREFYEEHKTPLLVGGGLLGAGLLGMGLYSGLGKGRGVAKAVDTASSATPAAAPVSAVATKAAPQKAVSSEAERLTSLSPDELLAELDQMNPAVSKKYSPLPPHSEKPVKIEGVGSYWTEKTPGQELSELRNDIEALKDVRVQRESSKNPVMAVRDSATGDIHSMSVDKARKQFQEKGLGSFEDFDDFMMNSNEPLKL